MDPGYNTKRVDPPNRPGTLLHPGHKCHSLVYLWLFNVIIYTGQKPLYTENRNTPVVPYTPTKYIYNF